MQIISQQTSSKNIKPLCFAVFFEDILLEDGLCKGQKSKSTSFRLYLAVIQFIVSV